MPSFLQSLFPSSFLFYSPLRLLSLSYIPHSHACLPSILPPSFPSFPLFLPYAVLPSLFWSVLPSLLPSSNYFPLLLPPLHPSFRLSPYLSRYFHIFLPFIFLPTFLPLLIPSFLSLFNFLTLLHPTSLPRLPFFASYLPHAFSSPFYTPFHQLFILWSFSSFFPLSISSFLAYSPLHSLPSLYSTLSFLTLYFPYLYFLLSFISFSSLSFCGSSHPPSFPSSSPSSPEYWQP